MTKRTRGLLPLSGDEFTLCRRVGLDEATVRDLDDILLAVKTIKVRAWTFTVLRFLARRGVRSQPKEARGNGPSPEAMARLDQVLGTTGPNATSPR